MDPDNTRFLTYDVTQDLTRTYGETGLPFWHNRNFYYIYNMVHEKIDRVTELLARIMRSMHLEQHYAGLEVRLNTFSLLRQHQSEMLEIQEALSSLPPIGRESSVARTLCQRAKENVLVNCVYPICDRNNLSVPDYFYITRSRMMGCFGPMATRVQRSMRRLWTRYNRRGGYGSEREFRANLLGIPTVHQARERAQGILAAQQAELAFEGRQGTHRHYLDEPYYPPGRRQRRE